MVRDSYRYVLVGGGLASASAAEGIRELDAEGGVLMIGDEPDVPYHRPPLTKGLLLGKKQPQDVFCKPEEFYVDKRIDLLLGGSVAGVDLKARRVSLGDGRRVSFERLLLATGSRARTLDLPGAALPGVFTVRTLSDALALISAMQRAKKAVVVGGGYIGAETAAALAQKGIRTTMVFPETRILERLADRELGRHLHGLFQAHDVAILTGQRPARIHGKNERVEAVLLEQGLEVPADIVVLGVGAVLNTEVLRRAGVPTDEDGGVPVDEFLRTAVADVYAAGDIARYPDPTFARRLRLEHWDVARKQGKAAGRNMAGAREPYTALPHYFTTLFDVGLSVWGDFSDWDETVRKEGAAWEGKPTVHYLEGGRLCGVLAFDPVDEEKEAAIEAWVRSRPQRSEVVRRLGEF